MLVKVFEAEEMSEALKMVKQTLGPDALILSTRTLRKGGRGGFGKPLLEVTAAVESPDLVPAPVSSGAGGGRAAQSAGSMGAGTPDPELSYRDIWRRSSVIGPAAVNPGEGTRGAAWDAANEGLASMRAELDELKAMLREVAIKPKEKQDRGFAQAFAMAGSVGGVQHLLGELTRWGIEAEAAEPIVRRAQERFTSIQLGEGRQLRNFLHETLRGMVPVTGSLFSRNPRQQRLALVGPTGVGKTTTLAKLAADYLTHHDGKAALVTIDTYRIAAVEQLKVYGEILCLPVEVVFTPEDLQAVFARHADKDLILIDTAGRSPRDGQSLDELTAFLGPDSGVSNQLVLAAPTRDRELQETVRRFGRLGLESLIFTKLDECEERGSLVNVPIRQNLPVSYLTNGQRVPEDLMTAKPATIADFIIGHA